MNYQLEKQIADKVEALKQPKALSDSLGALVGVIDQRTNDLDQYTERVMEEEMWVCPQCLISGRSRISNSAKLRIFRERPSVNCPDHFTLGYIRLKPSGPNV